VLTLRNPAKDVSASFIVFYRFKLGNDLLVSVRRPVVVPLLWPLSSLQVKPARVKDPNSGQMVHDYWESSKKLLSDPNFVTTLKEYDKGNVPPKVIDAIRKTYTSNPDFTPTNAAKASSAAEGMRKWVCAMDSYD
jgi:hypothetical protein